MFRCAYIIVMKTLIIGLGNPILGDDGVGWTVTREVESRLPSPLRPSPNNGSGDEGEIRADCLAVGGIRLMEQMIGYDRVILIDSINTGAHPQGTVTVFTLDELVGLRDGHSASAHDTTLNMALVLGRASGAELPQNQDVVVVAIQAEHVYDFTQALTPEIAAAVPQAVQCVIDLLQMND